VVGDLADLAVWMLVDVFICASHSQKIGRCTKRRVFVMRYLGCDVVKPRDVGAANEKNLRCVGEVGGEVEGNCAAVEGGVCVRHFGCRVYSVARNAWFVLGVTECDCLFYVATLRLVIVEERR
jgi:hypothetical protein